ncbi:unnamed protein product, partial [Rotaria socialis]
HSSFYFALIE